MDLKLATASQEILLGPFLDDDDGVTQKTGLTIANTDIKLFKTGGTTLGNKNSGGATEIATGFYYATLDATDTDTLGPLVIVVQMTDCLCVRHEFNVVSAAYYDWVYGSTKPDVNTYSIANDAITAAAIQNGAIDAATFAANAITSTVIADDAITAAKLNTGAITADAFAANAIEAAAIKDGAITNAKVADDVDVNVKTITAGAIAAASLNADMDTELATIIWNAAVASYGGAGTYGQAVEDTLADTNELQGNQGNWLTATGFSTHSAADVKTAIEADGSKLDHLWEMTEDDGGVRRLTTNALEQAPSGGLNATQVAAAVWDAVATSYDDAGSMGALLNDAGAAGDPWATAIPGAYGAGTAGLLLGTTIPNAIDAIDNYVDTEIGTLTTELAKVPKSDSNVSFNATAIAAIQNGLATPTNITAGTITTVTNLTNAPTNGDFTATMKSSITTAVPTAAAIGTDAAGKVLVTPAQKIVTDANGYVTYSNTAPPSAATIADAVWDETSTGHTDAGKAGQQLWTDVDAILADTNELQVDDTPTAIAAVKTVVDLIEDIVRNQMDITDLTGAVSLKDDFGGEMLTGSVTDNLTTTTRTRLS